VIELLSGEMGTLQMVLGWLLVCYPVLTLPVLIRFLSLTEDSSGEREHRGPRRSRRDEVYEDERRPRRLRAEELWEAEQSLRPELPVGAPTSALTLNQLLDVLEEASRIERVTAEPRADSRGVHPIELECLLEDEAELAVPETVTSRRVRRDEVHARRPDSLAERRERRTRDAARRVAGNPRMQRWVRTAARQLLARTGTEG
jgi:hypothetical protein